MCARGLEIVDCREFVRRLDRYDADVLCAKRRERRVRRMDDGRPRAVLCELVRRLLETGSIDTNLRASCPIAEFGVKMKRLAPDPVHHGDWRDDFQNPAYATLRPRHGPPGDQLLVCHDP